MLDRFDQAQGLRQLFARRSVRVLPIVASEDVQFAAFCGELAAVLARTGNRPAVLDADRGRLAPAFGLQARRDLLHVLTGECDIGAALCRDARGFALLPAARGLDALASRADTAQTFAAFGKLRPTFNVVMLIAPAARLVRTLGADIEPMVLAAADPGSVQAARTRLETLRTAHGVAGARLVWRACGTHSPAQAHAQLAAALSRRGLQTFDAGAFASARDAAAIERIATLALDAALPEFSTGAVQRRAASRAPAAGVAAAVR